MRMHEPFSTVLYMLCLTNGESLQKNGSGTAFATWTVVVAHVCSCI